HVHPDFAGIEFRSISGSGNFTLTNWQAFIEYMHEKQVLIFFLLDNEGQTEKTATRLLKQKRRFAAEGLERVIPANNRIQIWASSFEEANFTDLEIAGALTSLGL